MSDMSEEEFEKLQNITERMFKLIDIKDKQIKFLLQYLGGIVMPTQMNAITDRLEKIVKDE